MYGLKNRIAITGIGCISPWGDSVKSFREHFKAEQASGLHLVQDFDIKRYIKRRGLRTLPKSTKMAIASTQLALQDAKITLEDEDTERIGVFVGNSMSYLNNVNDFLEISYKKNAELVSPIEFPNTVLNNISGWVSIIYNFTGINSTVNTGNTSGIDAIIQAKNYIENGIIDKAIVIAVEDMGQGVIHNEFNNSKIDKKMTEMSISLVLEKNSDQKNHYGFINEVYSWMEHTFMEEKYSGKVSDFLADKPSIANVIWGSGNKIDSQLDHLFKKSETYLDKQVDNIHPYIGTSYSLSGIIKLTLGLFRRGQTLILETNEFGNNCFLVIEP